MRKAVLAIAIVAIALACVSCDPEQSYKVGGKGPAGGWIFYDCDADNESGNADGLVSTDCGWRWLEVADMEYANVMFGFYRTSDDGQNLYTNDTTTFSSSTGKAVGTGSANTLKLVEKMGSYAYSGLSGSNKRTGYAAKICADLNYGGYDDWFLPSLDELELMYENLGTGNKYGLSGITYWSSSEYELGAGNAWCYKFSSGESDVCGRGFEYAVRPVRAFI